MITALATNIQMCMELLYSLKDASRNFGHLLQSSLIFYLWHHTEYLTPLVIIPCHICDTFVAKCPQMDYGRGIAAQFTS